MQIIAIIVAVLLFCLTVIIHEFGHFYTSKLLGVKVDEFAVGMGPVIRQKQHGETVYSLRAFPIGGFCRLEGEEGGSTDKRSFSAQPAWKKIIILAAGAFMNAVLCILILFLVFLYTGTLSAKLSSVAEGMPAAEAGIQAGDTITSVNGREYSQWSDIVTAIADSEGDTVTITAERDGQSIEFECPTVYSESAARKVIGITAGIAHSPAYAVSSTFSTCKEFYASMGEFLTTLFRGKASSDDVVGVVGLAGIVTEQARYGIANVAYVMAIISLNLGFVNMLPFPALDGGRILFVIIRAVSGGRLSEKAEEYIHAGGMIIILAVMVLLIFKDTIGLLR